MDEIENVSILKPTDWVKFSVEESTEFHPNRCKGWGVASKNCKFYAAWGNNHLAWAL